MKLTVNAIFQLCLSVGMALVPVVAHGAPVLYSQAFYQSPVMAVPGQPLMLPGFNLSADDTVVYQLLEDTTMMPSPPSELPAGSDPLSGVAQTASSMDAPYSLTVNWPKDAEINRSYAVWVRDSRGNWSNGIRVNDARPLWITPAYAYESDRIGSLSRYLKVVGRNLQPGPGAQTRVKLENVATREADIILVAENDGDPGTVLDQYVAKVNLPARLKEGEYRVLVSRDGKSWVPVRDQSLAVRRDPLPEKEIHVSKFGCRADDGLDDARCIRKALTEAVRAPDGRAVVVFGEGVWDLSSLHAGSIVIPRGVSLKGAGPNRTTLLGHPEGREVNVRRSTAWFTLQGMNTVHGITFRDESIYQSAERQGAVLQLGEGLAGEEALAGNVSDIIIKNNIFDRPFRAITGGVPIARLFIVHNEFGAFENAIILDGLPGGGRLPFRIQDSVVAENVFKPGSYIDVSRGQGVIATQIGASKRVDFSENTADGSSVEYLYDPENDPSGWRAAFFWHMRYNHEMLLVSRNRATCTGDKAGDGEAFAFDNNQNSFGFANAQPVISATNTTVTVPGSLQTRHRGRQLPPGYFRGHWLQVADGAGVGQVRRIVSYEERDDHVRVSITPPWDVTPGIDSKIMIGLEYWQILVLDNHIDHSRPPCLKSNRRKAPSRPFGAGSIALWAQAADSVIAGNKQKDTNGIKLHPFYSAPGKGCNKCTAATMLQYFLEVRGNTIDGEYDWGSDCSWSGITVTYGASPTRNRPPPVISYGLVVAGNSVLQADGFSGGGVSVAPSWFDGPESYPLSLIRSAQINNNVFRNLKGPIRDDSCNRRLVSRSAIMLASPRVRNTVITANLCINTGKDPIRDRGENTLVIQETADPHNCEYRHR